MELNKREMCEIVGGVSWELLAAIGGFIVYLIGAVNGYTNPNQCNNWERRKMYELKAKEMKAVYGGSISSQILNAISKMIEVIYTLGESTGSSIRRLTSGEYCPMN